MEKALLLLVPARFSGKKATRRGVPADRRRAELLAKTRTFAWEPLGACSVPRRLRTGVPTNVRGE